MSTVLVVGAHPDDIEIGAGGILHAMGRAGHRTVAVDLTDGELTPHGDRVTRKEETARASEILGLAERRCLDLPNRTLMDDEAARRKLAAVMRKVRPDLVLTHQEEDVHPDHVATARIVRGAVLLSRIVKIDLPHGPWRPGRTYAFHASHMKRVYTPGFVVAMEKASFEAKMAAILAYESQFGAKYGGLDWMREHITARETMYGRLVGAPYAEAFFTDEVIGVGRLDDLLGGRGAPTVPAE